MYDELYNAVKVRFGQGSASQAMGDWICDNTTIKKRPFSFDHYHFQKAIADDMHPDLTVIKCSQIGLTEVQIRKFLAILTRGTAISGIFTLPNEKMYTRIYNARIKPIVDADSVFNPPVASQPVRRRDQIQIRDSFGYITGCTEGDATSISADFLMHDELDLSPQDMIALYQSRLQGSDMQMTQKFSTPSFNGYGIHKSFTLTDQREYLARCSACNHWQIPRFTPNFIHIDNYPFEVENFTDLSSEQIEMLDLSTTYVRCEHCKRRLDLGNVELREWVATFPSRTNFRGYQVRPFSTSRLKPQYVFTQLAKYQHDGYLRGFFNTVIGEPFDSASNRIQEADVHKCMAGGAIPDVGPEVPVYLGVDIGFTCHLTLSIDGDDGRPVFVLFESIPVTQLETRIAELRKIYTIIQGAADRFPFTPTVDALRDATQGLIVPIQYRGTAALAPVHEPDTKLLTHYSANRTLILDRIHSLVGRHALVLSGYTNHKETLVAHLCDMIRDERPDVEAEWKKHTGNDHFFHAMALSLLARRVCDHMFTTQSTIIAASSDLMGANWGTTGNLVSASPTSAKRISRLGNR